LKGAEQLSGQVFIQGIEIEFNESLQDLREDVKDYNKRVKDCFQSVKKEEKEQMLSAYHLALQKYAFKAQQTQTQIQALLDLVDELPLVQPKIELEHEGMFLEVVRQQLESDWYKVKDNLEAALEGVERYNPDREVKSLKEAAEVHRNAYHNWARELNERLNRIELLYLNADRIMDLGGFSYVMEG
jgi:hypothetical protein